MNPTNLPTSNVYVYLTIFGLVAVIAAFGFAHRMESEARKKVIEFAHASTENIRESRDYSIGFEKLPEPEKQKIRNRLEYNQSKLNTLSSEVMVAASEFEKSLTVRLWGSVFGGLISLLGLVLWYSRVQKVNDAILKRQSSAPERPIERNSTSPNA